jgi:hypothetical protein
LLDLRPEGGGGNPFEDGGVRPPGGVSNIGTCSPAAAVAGRRGQQGRVGRHKKTARADWGGDVA